MIFGILEIAVFTMLGIRTAAFWLQNWQIREYRIDRMRANLKTKDGQKTLWNLWFFSGILPRPKISSRILLISLFFLTFSILEIWGLNKSLPLLLIVIIWERTIFFTTFLSVILSKILVYFVQKRLFSQAKKVISQSENCVKIAIAGSYGKSSTKEILASLIEQKMCSKNVLKNPENQNNEVAIARLILKNKAFFERKEKRVFIVEMGAYCRGEIQKICNFVQPDFSILTGLNEQHLELFGSIKNTQLAKFEAAQATKDKVFFMATNKLLVDVFDRKEIKAEKIPVKKSDAKIINSTAQSTEFEFYNLNFTLNWGGEFFVENAILAIEMSREVGVSFEEATKSLPNIPSLDRALQIEETRSGTTILWDLYSANPDGVSEAIKHLSKFKGRKIFIGMPMLELGKNTKKIHKHIFCSLRDIKADVFWFKSDFSEIALKTCEKKFHGNDLNNLQKTLSTLGKNDAVLCESRLDKNTLNLISKTLKSKRIL
jgi:UDP-N-acetylmuramoyl-tripeptide--D-alanyl-D-alanine ligase